MGETFYLSVSNPCYRQTKVCPTLAPLDGSLFKRRTCRGARRRALMRNLNVSAAQGYRIERQTRNDRSARSGHPQAELIVTSRLAVVNDRDAERMVPHAVERRLSDEHSRIADNRERLHGSALEFHLAGWTAFDVKQFALRAAVLLVLDVEPEVGAHAVVDDGSAACDESERRIVNDKHRIGGASVIGATYANGHVIDVHWNVRQGNAGIES